MRHGSLFSGIGGFDLAAEWMGWQNVFQVEIDEFCQKVLTKNFPNVRRYHDIKQFDATEYSGKIDIITGGFPCQPFSVAGHQLGTQDDRFIWKEMLRTIRDVQPDYVVAENVPGLLSQSGGLVFEQVCAEMEDEGYEVQAVNIPACGINAPHKRERIWIIAHTNSIGRERGKQGMFTQQQIRHDTQSLHGRSLRYSRFGNDLPTSRIFGTGYGIPNGVDRIKSLGNAIVPQVAYEIFKAIHATTNQKN